MMLASRADLEEERRLFYVAVTRAQQKVFLSYALSRYRFGRLKHCDPSRFIEDIDPAYVQVNTYRNAQEAGYTRSHTSYATRLVRTSKKPSQPLKQAAATSYQHMPPSDLAKIQVGVQVSHPKFGLGTVMHLGDKNDLHKARILFDGFGEKTLLLNFAKLKIVDPA